MRHTLFTAAALLLGCNTCLAQISTMGTTAMGLPSTPGAIITSRLNGPSPFSATTQLGAPDTTLAPLPLASDPTTPGTVVTCSTPSGQIGPGTPAVPVASPSFTTGAIGTIPSNSAVPTISAVPANSSASANGSTVTAGQTASLFPGATRLPPAAIQTQRLPSITAVPVPASSPALNPVSTSVMMPAAPLGTIPTPIVGSTTGTISPASPLGTASTVECSSTPGGPPSNGAALPLSTPEIPSSPAPGTIQAGISEAGGTSIDPSLTVVPTPNSAACREGVTMSLANPGMMAPANATGAAATPGVTPVSGC